MATIREPFAYKLIKKTSDIFDKNKKSPYLCSAKARSGENLIQ